MTCRRGQKRSDQRRPAYKIAYVIQYNMTAGGNSSWLTYLRIWLLLVFTQKRGKMRPYAGLFRRF